MGNDRGGRVHGFYDRNADSTFISTNRFSSPLTGHHFVNAYVRVAGRTPAATGGAQVTAFLIGNPGLAIANAPGLPVVRIEINDSIAHLPTPVARGRYDGPPAGALVPVSFAVPAPTLLEILTAERVKLSIGDIEVPFGRDTQRDFRALYRVVTCVELR